MKFMIAGLLAVMILTQPLSLIAAQSTFTTSLTTFGTDTTPPTVPTNLVATPVSTSEIDLTWTASTDNFTVAGYRVFRDSNFLATTSVPSYADTGLTASTTYSYTVQAFDQSINISGQTAPVATTTFAIVIPPTPTSTPTQNPPTGGIGGSTNIVISNVHADPSSNQLIVSFDTSVATQAKLSWGLTNDLEGGSLMSMIYGTSHQLLIGGLMPDTAYVVRIQVTDAIGRTAFMDVTFRTAVPVNQPLPNPSLFTAVGYNDHISLDWQKPTDPRVTGVRIVRSESFFPKDQNDGVEVYQGPSSSFTDRNVVADRTYYYSAFSYDSDGHFSSGAIASVKTPATAGTVTISGDPFANLPLSTKVDPVIAALGFKDFEYIQDGRELTPVNDNVIAIDGKKDLTIRLAYNKVPEILKTIAFTLTDPTDATKVFPFLLRVNADHTYYTATIGALGRTGTYSMHIVILDYQNQGLKRLSGSLQALVIGSLSGITNARIDLSGIILLLLLILIVILFLMLLDRRHKKLEANENR